MKVSILENSPVLVRISLCGELNASEASQVEQELSSLLTGIQRSVVLDVSEVSKMTSLGISVLIRVYNQLKRRGLKLVLFKPQESVAEVLKLSRLSEILNVVRTDSELMGKLRESD